MKTIPSNLYPKVLDLINETYVDKMDSIESAQVDEDGTIEAIGIDEGAKYVCRYQNGVIEIKALSPDESPKTAGFAAGKARNCKTGISCGNSCISKAKTCRKKGTSGQAEKAKEITALVWQPGKGSPAEKAKAETKPKSKRQIKEEGLRATAAAALEKSKATTNDKKALEKSLHVYFDVKNNKELKASGRYKMATNGMDKNDPEVTQKLYRKLVGVIPGEENLVGKGIVNDKYFKPWTTFGLDGQTATPADIKKAYGDLAKKFHPDNKQTGDAAKFQRLNQMYLSIKPDPKPEPKSRKK